MYNIEDRYTMNLQDGYTLIYFYLSDALIESFGLEGERVVREATRKFGRDRGLHSRQRHQGINAKINMESLFGLPGDLPADPRFKRELQHLMPEERVSHTLICPMADLWKAYGGQSIGRIYCEEFHFACYNTYAFNQTQVNLAKTLTQDGDEYCAFNIVLRPENLSTDLKKACFATYDPNYIGQTSQLEALPGKVGFETLWVKIFHYFLQESTEAFGVAGRKVVGEALEKAARDALCRIEGMAALLSIHLSVGLVDENYPLSISGFQDDIWNQYNTYEGQALVSECFLPIFREKLGE